MGFSTDGQTDRRIDKQKTTNMTKTKYDQLLSKRKER
jgi:hypothetical protein